MVVVLVKVNDIIIVANSISTLNDVTEKNDELICYERFT